MITDLANKYFVQASFALKAAYLLIGLSIATFLSVTAGMETSITSDFTVFWQAGKNFWEGQSLYNQTGGACRYIYPPLAAMLFGLFSIFPLKIAAGLWAFSNCLFWIMIIKLTKDIFDLLGVRSKSLTGFVLAFLLSARFFLYHIAYIQMNEVVLVLTLHGIKYQLQHKENKAIVCLALATQIKILPVLFLFWLLSRGNIKTLLKIALVMTLMTILPFLFRNTNQSLADLLEYYQTFIGPFKEGRVEPDYQNYGLAAAIYKWCVPNVITGDNFPHPTLGFSITTAQILVKISSIMLALLYLALVLSARFRKKKTSIYEISAIFLITHLISGITWEYHLVSLFFVFSALFYSFNFKHPLNMVFLAFIILNSIAGLDTLGNTLYHYSCDYSFLTILLILLLGKIILEEVLHNKPIYHAHNLEK